jgi:hypothetical protein
MAAAEREHYFNLSVSDQADLLRSLAPLIGLRAEILEKDIWLCQVLGILFGLSCRKPMAFKGGTSLSKVYRAIDRFSEDIDVTVDYRSLVDDAPDLSMINNSQRTKLSTSLKTALAEHVVKELAPSLQKALDEAIPNNRTSISISEDAEKLWVYYPSAVENADEYLRPSILIEFGGRNSTLPQTEISITPDIAAYVPDLAFPVVHVTVLSAARTFWEKATLIHVECHRPTLRPSAERMSRHWYDLARLADHEVGAQALNDIDLLRDVLSIKETFYRSGYSNYSKCISGGMRLIPDGQLLDALRQDYQAMVSAQMFYADVLEFGSITERLRKLEHQINSSF